MELGSSVRLMTGRLALEPLRMSHVDEMVGVLADERLYTFTGGSAPSIEVLRDRYRRQSAGSGRDGEHWFNWIVRHTETGQAGGYVQATGVGERAEVAWRIGVGHQGRGFAVEAATAMCTWLGERGVGTFAAHIALDHGASTRVAERLGLQRTGTVDADGEAIWEMVRSRA